MKKILILFLIIFSLASLITAQSKVNDDIFGASIYSCEEFSARVDAIRSTAKDTGKRIFAIFHAGKTESEIINIRRLAYVRDFLRSDIKQWDELDVIYARGDKLEGHAVIAFYVGGDLAERMGASRNMTPCMDCCEARYYMPQSLLKPINFKTVRNKRK